MIGSLVTLGSCNLICYYKILYACVLRTGKCENADISMHLSSVYSISWVCLFVVVCVLSVYHPILVTIYER